MFQRIPTASAFGTLIHATDGDFAPENRRLRGCRDSLFANSGVGTLKSCDSLSVGPIGPMPHRPLALRDDRNGSQTEASDREAEARDGDGRTATSDSAAR